MRRLAKRRRRAGREAGVRKTAAFDYLLVEYLKNASNETAYLLLIITSLLFFVLINFFPAAVGQNFETIRMVFVILILGGFAMFGMTTLEKRSIEKRLLEAIRQ